MEKKTILIVAPIHNELIGGLKYSIPNMAKSLQNINYNVCLITTNKKEFQEDSSVPIYHYYDNRNNYTLISNLPKPFNKPDLILFQSTYIYAHSKLAKQAIKLNIPYVITPRGGMTLEAQNQKKFKKRIGNLLFFNDMVKNAEFIHCLTKKESENLIKWNAPFFIVPNGINKINNDDYNVDNKHINISFIGRMDINHKGLDIFLDALSIVNERIKFHKLSVNLYGPEVGNSYERLQRIIDNNKLNNFVKIYNSIGSEEKDRVLRNTQLFAHTSRFEGHPVSVLEAMSYGIPVLVTPGTNINEEIRDYNAGWAANESEESVAECVIEIINNTRQLEIRGKNAKMLVIEKYTWEVVGNKMSTEINRIIKKYDSN